MPRKTPKTGYISFFIGDKRINKLRYHSIEERRIMTAEFGEKYPIGHVVILPDEKPYVDMLNMSYTGRYLMKQSQNKTELLFGEKLTA